jgi:hypothetical protein
MKRRGRKLLGRSFLPRTPFFKNFGEKGWDCVGDGGASRCLVGKGPHMVYCIGKAEQNRNEFCHEFIKVF